MVFRGSGCGHGIGTPPAYYNGEKEIVMFGWSFEEYHG